MNTGLKLTALPTPAASTNGQESRPVRVAALAALIGMLAVAISTSVAQTPVNDMCPVMTEENAKTEFTTIYDGHVVGFCCEKCLAKFTANPDRYVGRLGNLESKSPVPNPDHAHDDDPGANQLAGSPDHGVHSDHSHADNTGGDVTPGGASGHEHDAGNHSDGAEGTHDHEHGHAQGKGFFTRLIGWLGGFHPPMVNFPIAMILGAALAESLLLATKRSFFVNAGRFCLWVGCVGAVVATVLGWFFGGFHLVDDSWILTTHRWLGTTTAAWSVLLLVVGERTNRRGNGARTCYRTLLFIGATLVGVSGFFGGSLIYGVRHYAWS